MRVPPKPRIPSGNVSGSIAAVRNAIAKELRRMCPLRCLLYRPIIRSSHVAPTVLVVRIEGMSHLSASQFESLVSVMNDAAPPYATCVLTLGEKTRG